MSPNSYASRNDALFLRNTLNTQGRLNIPLIRKQEVHLENISLLPYNLIKINDKKHAASGIHFFIDDYRFEKVYRNPEQEFLKLKQYAFLFSPDFSLYEEMPLWKQIENVAKNRWCGAYWQYKGAVVIPSVSWSSTLSFDFCFDGLEQGGVFALSPIGTNQSKMAFMKGYDELLKRKAPSCIICLGKTYKEMAGNILEIPYSRTSKIQTKLSISENNGIFLASDIEAPFLPFKEFINIATTNQFQGDF